MKKDNLTKIVFGFAILFAIFTRFWKLTSLPFPPEGDELAFGYYGWSLLHYGTDEYGNKLPSSFVSIGDYKYPGLTYLNIIPAGLFGLNDITPRFWSAISGVFLVYLMYKLTDLITQKREVAVVAAWLSATSPWSLIESRLGWENHMAMVLVLAGFYLLFRFSSKHKSIKKVGNNYFYLAILLFILSVFTYAAERIFLPLILVGLVVLSFQKNSNHRYIRNKIITLLITISVLSIILIIPTSGRGRAGEDLWKGLSHEQTDHLEQVYVQAGISPVKIPPRVTWFFHNKYIITFKSFLERYSDHFSPSFLFFEGEAVKESLPDMGLLLYIELLLLPIGLITFLFHNSKNDNIEIKQFFLIWLFLAPIPSALTSGPAHINRASLMIPPLIFISSFGFHAIANIFKGVFKKMTVLIISFGVVISSFYTLNQMFVQKPVNRPWHKEQVYKNVSLDVLELKDNYDTVVTRDDDYIYYLFYGKISPFEFLQNSDITSLSENTRWERVNRLYNIVFKMPFNCPKSGKLNTLYVCSGNEIPQNSKLVKIFYYLDKIPAFTFIEFYPLSEMPETLPTLPENLHYMVEVENSLNFPDGIIPSNYASYW